MRAVCAKNSDTRPFEMAPDPRMPNSADSALKESRADENTKGE